MLQSGGWRVGDIRYHITKGQRINFPLSLLKAYMVQGVGGAGRRWSRVT